MKEERHRGKITREGFYELDRDKDNLYRDAWLDELDENPEKMVYQEKKKVRKITDEDAPVEESADAIQAKFQDEDDQPEIIEEIEDFRKFSGEDIQNMKKEVCDMLNPKETSAQALKRLGPHKQVQKKGNKNVRKKDKVQKDDSQGKEEEKEGKLPAKPNKEEELEILNTRYFNRLIELCDKLASSGYVDVYSDTKEEIKAEIAKNESAQNKKKYLFLQILNLKRINQNLV